MKLTYNRLLLLFIFIMFVSDGACNLSEQSCRQHLCIRNVGAAPQGHTVRRNECPIATSSVSGHTHVSRPHIYLTLTRVIRNAKTGVVRHPPIPPPPVTSKKVAHRKLTFART
eukprot:45788-Eustigmatos_ZCMA.PRE.1